MLLIFAWVAMAATPTVEAAIIVDQADIIDGEVDVTEDGAVNTLDDLLNVDLNDEFVVNQVDIINGLIDVNEDGVVNAADDATNVDLVRPN